MSAPFMHIDPTITIPLFKRYTTFLGSLTRYDSLIIHHHISSHSYSDVASSLPLFLHHDYMLITTKPFISPFPSPKPPKTTQKMIEKLFVYVFHTLSSSVSLSLSCYFLLLTPTACLLLYLSYRNPLESVASPCT